jgi:hypothetical protein
MEASLLSNVADARSSSATAMCVCVVETPASALQVRTRSQVQLAPTSIQTRTPHHRHTRLGRSTNLIDRPTRPNRIESTFHPISPPPQLREAERRQCDDAAAGSSGIRPRHHAPVRGRRLGLRAAGKVGRVALSTHRSILGGVCVSMCVAWLFGSTEAVGLSAQLPPHIPIHLI